MQLKMFSVPFHNASSEVDEVNAFLRSHRVLSIDRNFIQDGNNSTWAICVTYVEASGRPQGGNKKAKIDYREVLSETDFALYARLRDLRKAIAEQEGVPPYALFTNEQLATMVQNKTGNKTALKEIPGVGDARVEKYGPAFIRMITDVSSNNVSEQESR